VCLLVQNGLRTLLGGGALGGGGAPTGLIAPGATHPRYATDDDYFAFADRSASDTQPTQGKPVPEEATNKCDLEVLQYLEDKNKELSILNSYQMVKKVFVRYNAVLPSSAAVERLFSFAGLITRPHRRSMSDKTFEHLLLLKGNK
jgi:hypothetical protein